MIWLKTISATVLWYFITINIAFSQQDEIELLKSRLIEDALVNKGFVPRVGHYITPDFEAAAQYLAAQNFDGSWTSVDYLDTDNSWDPLSALNKILVMSVAYNQSSDPLYQNEKLLSGIERALTYWYQVDPTCVNWYKNDIAKQMYLGPIAILLKGQIRDDLLYQMIEDQTPAPRMTGSNRTLVSTSVFYRGVLEKNPARIKSGIRGVMDPVKISYDEGIQPDYSFHQHGPFLYNGSYGSNFLRETAWIASMVEGTSYAFSEEHIRILRDYFLQGTRWMIWKGLFDYNARGRQVGRPSGFGQDADKQISILNYLMAADPANKDTYLEIQASIKHLRPQELSGLKHFWRSDYTVSYQDHFYTTVKMCSERTIGMETDVNHENLLGRYLPYGLTYIYRRGDEYEDIFPVWNWARLPGVTSPDTVPVEKGKYTQQTRFVGGATDGAFGVSAMDLQLNTTAGKKAWFWFEEGFVALGAGITSNNENTLFTGINQSNLQGKVFVDGDLYTAGASSLQPVQWVWHDSTAYIFPDSPSNVQIEALEKSGNLHRIFGLEEDTVYRKEVFSLWYNHGVRPANETYAYGVFPGVSREETQALTKKPPIEVLSNNENLQAIQHTSSERMGFAFYKVTDYPLSKKITLSVSDPCLVVINKESNKITVSDPTTKLDEVTVSFERKNGKKNSVTVSLPDGEYSGQSKTIDLKIKL